MQRKKILFICTHNSARSQMAEGLVNHLWSTRFRAFSAGTEPGTVNPNAIAAMKEIGIDISGARSKSVNKFVGKPFDLVVTVCDQAKQNCPFFPGAREYIHRSFEEPSGKTGSEVEILRLFREIRDDIKSWLENFLVNY
jgi:arsenate reductase